MRIGFAQTSNVTRFLSGIATVEQRGAKEAGWLLVTGEAGFGKSRTVQWWAIQNNAVYLRAKAAITPHWLLLELVRELGHVPANSNEKLFQQALTALARDPRPVVVDEVEHTLHDSRVLESIRDISDLIEIPVILVGMERVQTRISRHPQISSRIAQVVVFKSSTEEDVQACCETLCEVKVDGKLMDEILNKTGGRIREVINAIASVERQAKRNKLTEIGLKEMSGLVLTHDWQARKPRIVRRAK